MAAADLFSRPEGCWLEATWTQQLKALALLRQRGKYQLLVVMAMEVSSPEGHEYSGDDVVLDETTQRSPVLGDQVLAVGGGCSNTT